MMQTPPSGNGPMRPGGPPLDRLGTDAGASGRREASADDAQRFSDMMRRDGEAAGQDPSQHNDGGDAVLPGPFDLLRPGSMGGTRAEGLAAGRGGDLQQIVQAVADRVMVSEGGDGAQEVRIHLKDSVLPGVEVRVRQEQGRMVVEFVSQNADSTRFLDAQRGALGAMLEGRLKTDVEVRVTTSDGTETSGESGNGRSREDYVAPDEEDPDAAGESAS